MRFWVHNGFLSVESTKMSKSLGNFVTVHELLEQGVPGEAIRLALLSTHYRDPLDWTDDKLEQAKATLDRWYRALSGFRGPASNTAPAVLLDALEEDLNTPLAITQLHEIAGVINRASSPSDRARWQAELAAGGGLLGLLQQAPREWLQRPPPISGSGDLQASASVVAGVGQVKDNLNGSVEELIQSRAVARKERRFADADRIRAELAAKGIVLEDRPDGTTEWRRA